VAELRVVDAEIGPVLDTIERDGGVIVPGMLRDDAVVDIVADLETALAATQPGSTDPEQMWHQFHGANTKRFTGLAARSDAFVDHGLLNPLLLAVADALLLPNAADYWLNTGQVMAIGPGEPAQVIHRDEGNWPEVRRPGLELTISCMFALSDFTAENGATVVVPGSHLVDAEHSRSIVGSPTDDPAYAVMPAGSGMIYTGKVLHGAGHNASTSWRYGLHVSFVVGWLRPEEASPLMVDQTRAAQLPPRARELLGWSSYRSDGGGRTWLVDFEDAARLFEEDKR
jgi:ectoine hydroxylase-related dioxygenase (phytanoyl-CoA dioxygenase family)